MLNGLIGYIAYAAGHAFVASIAYAGYRLLYREPDLAARRSAIAELVDRAARTEAGAEEVNWARDRIRELELRRQEVEDALVNRVPLHDTPATMRAFAVLSAIFLELEALVFFMLSAPSHLLGLEPGAWAFFAFPVAVAWVLMLHVLMGAVVSDRNRPARTVRRARAGAVGIGAAVVLGISLVLAGRNFTSKPELVETLTTTGLMMLAALVSVCSAFCSIVATTISEAHSAVRERKQLDSTLARYRRHIDLIERDVVRFADPASQDARSTAARVDGGHKAAGDDAAKPPGRTQTAPTARPASPANIVSTLMLLVALLVLPVTGRANELSADGQEAVPAPRQVSRSLFAPQGACEIAIDVSRSVDRKARQAALDNMSGQLGQIVDSLGCRVIRLVSFAADPVLSLEEFDVPLIEKPTEDCQNATLDASSATEEAVSGIYPAVREARRRKNVADCTGRQQSKADDQAAARAAVIAQVGQRLRMLGALDSSGRCTGITQAIERSLLRSDVVVMVTDGMSSCPRPKPATRAPANAFVLLILLPSASNSQRDSSSSPMATNIEQAFPAAKTVLAPEATVSFWRGLGGRR